MNLSNKVLKKNEIDSVKVLKCRVSNGELVLNISLEI